MSVFDRIFGRVPQIRETNNYFKLLDGYCPVFHNWRGGIYESELCRISIDTIARNCQKLQLTTTGGAKGPFYTNMKKAPNDMQTWTQFLYRVATVLYVNNNCFLVPVIGDMGENVGVTVVVPASWELIDVNGEAWIRFKFSNGQAAAIELNRIGILTRFQYKNDYFGENNNAMKDTLDLIKIQRQGINESTKNAASYRFMARIGNFTKAEDLAKERQTFNKNNFEKDGGGILLFPNTYSDIKQLNAQAYEVDDKQIALIQRNVFNYFGVNEDVIQNKAYGDAWSAFYEGCIEPFAIQLSEVLTKMFFTDREQASGNAFFFTSNRLQYMSNNDKLNVTTQLLDRGILTINQALEIWQLPGIGEEGDVRIIRGEYYNADEKVTETEGEVIDGE